MRKVIGAVLGAVLFIVIGFFLPVPVGLDRNGMMALGIVCMTICLLVAKTLPSFAACLLMCALSTVLGVAPAEVAFESFTGSTFWLVVGILGIGTAVTKCGLIKRLSLMMISLFPASFKGMMTALMGIGVLFAPLMPSTTAKLAIIGPVAMGVGNTLQLEKRSWGMAGIFSATYIGWCISGLMFFSASYLNPIVLGALPENAQQHVTWGSWFIGMLPWSIGLLVFSYIAFMKIYAPKEHVTLSKDYIHRQIDELGPVSKHEKISSGILLICIFLWITESFHGIDTYITALGGMIALTAFGVFDEEDFRLKMPWGLIFMTGCILNMAPIMNHNHISDWLGGLIGPLLENVISNPYLFTTLLLLAGYGIRFILPEMIVPMVLLTTILGPLAQAAGWNPWVVGMMSYSTVCIWSLIYQNPVFLVGWAVCGGEEQNDFRKVRLSSWVYMAANLVCMLISIPFWKILGYIPK